MKNLSRMMVGSYLLIILLSGCLSEQNTPVTTSTTQIQADASSVEGSDESSSDDLSDIKVELYHFHGDRQCVSCKTVGSLAEKTVNTYFQKELESGKLVFGHINYDDFANGELSTKYDAKSSSLWIGTYIDGKFNKEENTRVWYKINEKEDYLQYLKGVLDKRLSGDLSE